MQGGSAVVCLHFLFNQTTTPVIKTYAFKTTVDNFSALKVNGLSNLLKNNSAQPIYVVVQAQNSSITTQMVIISIFRLFSIQL